MAGEGQRFKDQGYQTPKPLLDIDGIPMFIRAALSLPNADRYIFVCRSDQIPKGQLEPLVQKYFSDSIIHYIDQLAAGQAASCISARQYIPDDASVTIGPSDSAMIYSKELWDEFLMNSEKEAIVWTIKGHPSMVEKPHMYGWVNTDWHSGKVFNVSCKKVISNHPAADPAIIGCFSFKKAVQFFDAIDKMISLNDTVNGEYYVDVAMNHAISADVKVYILGIQQYICWGTPVDYESYVSWLNYYKHEKVFGR